MKKIAMVLACFALVSMTATAQLAQITLMHDGNATMFNANQTDAALDAAVDGDVLYFTEGSFTGNITITKKVTLVGVGEGTVLNGDITIYLTESAATMPAQMLDALQLTGSIIMKSKTNGMKIRKCKFDSFKYFSNNIVTTNCTIDRCFINGTMNLNSHVEGMTVLSSKIKLLQGMAATASGATLVNCNIWEITNNSSNSRLLATLINSIIYSAGSQSYIHKDCMFINCLSSKNASSNIGVVINAGVNNNCYTGVIFYMSSDTMEPSGFVNNSLEDFLGTDGTVVGITGGAAPFTLVPAAPRITESVIKVDPETKKLNVNLKVTAN